MHPSNPRPFGIHDLFHPAREQAPCLFEQLEERVLMSADGLMTPYQLRGGRSTWLDAPVFAAPRVSITAPTVGVSNGSSAGIFESVGNNGQGVIRATQFLADPRFAGIRGAGFSSVVIDTGINASHPFFGPDNNNDGVADRVLYQWNFAGNSGLATDLNGHGSNVAGAIGSSDPGAPGVASETGIIGLRVFDSNGSASMRTVESALRWVINNRDTYNIASVNLSLGDGMRYSQPTSNAILSDELAQLAEMGVIVVAAAGNSFYDFSSQPGLSYPAADPNIISVGAIFGNTGGTYTYAGGAQGNASAGAITPFSQRAPWMDVFAPGAPITGPAATGTGTISMHGTSQAAPIVAGAAVLIQQLAVNLLGRRLTLDEFRTLLHSGSGTIWDGNNGPSDDPVENDNVTPTEQSYRLLDLVALGTALYEMAGVVNAAPPLPNAAPTISTASVITGAVNGRGMLVSYEQLLASTNAADANDDQLGFVVRSVQDGRLTLNGRTVQPGVTVVQPGDTLVWTPAAGATGNRAAFQVGLTDGREESSGSVGVQFAVSNETRPIIPGVPDSQFNPDPFGSSGAGFAPMAGLEVLPGSDASPAPRTVLAFLDAAGVSMSQRTDDAGSAQGRAQGADQLMAGLSAGLNLAA